MLPSALVRMRRTLGTGPTCPPPGTTLRTTFAPWEQGTSAGTPLRPRNTRKPNRRRSHRQTLLGPLTTLDRATIEHTHPPTPHHPHATRHENPHTHNQPKTSRNPAAPAQSRRPATPRATRPDGHQQPRARVSIQAKTMHSDLSTTAPQRRPTHYTAHQQTRTTPLTRTQYQ